MMHGKTKIKFLDRFSKNIQISSFLKIRIVGDEMFIAERRTDTTKLLVAFSNFVHVSKNEQLYEKSVASRFVLFTCKAVS